MSTTFAPVRRAVVCGLLTLGIFFGAASASVGQTPTTSAPTSSSTSSTPSSTSAPPTVPKVATAGGGGGTHLPTLGEGFPWITVGAIVLVAGVVGTALRRAARR